MVRTAVLVLLATALLGCGISSPEPAEAPSGSAARTSPSATRAPSATPSRTGPSPLATRPRTTAAAPAEPSVEPSEEPGADPRWRFFTDDRTRYASPWFAGRHRLMIGYGCTRAPYYDPDPRCPGRQGFHHGVDVAIPCGRLLRSGVDGVVLDPSGPGAPGPAYGDRALRIRAGDRDVLLGHVERALVRPGRRVRTGEPVAVVGDRGAPDGCHLHLEVRRAGGGVEAAVDPARVLALR